MDSLEEVSDDERERLKDVKGQVYDDFEKYSGGLRSLPGFLSPYCPWRHPDSHASGVYGPSSLVGMYRMDYPRQDSLVIQVQSGYVHGLLRGQLMPCERAECSRFGFLC